MFNQLKIFKTMETKGKKANETVTETKPVVTAETRSDDITILQGERIPVLIVSVTKRVSAETGEPYFMVGGVNLTDNSKLDFSISHKKAVAYEWVKSDGTGEFDRIANAGNVYIHTRVTRVPNDGKRYGYIDKQGEIHEYRNNTVVIDRWEGQLSESLAEETEKDLLQRTAKRTKMSTAKIMFFELYGYDPDPDNAEHRKLLYELSKIA